MRLRYTIDTVDNGYIVTVRDLDKYVITKEVFNSLVDAFAAITKQEKLREKTDV